MNIIKAVEGHLEETDGTSCESSLENGKKIKELQSITKNGVVELGNMRSIKSKKHECERDTHTQTLNGK